MGLTQVLKWLSASALAAVQMIEELVMATMMSIAFSLPTWYLCQLKGSFFIWWLTWLVSLADGIGVYYPTKSSPLSVLASIPRYDVPKAALYSDDILQ